jgi:hypothetical protein
LFGAIRPAKTVGASAASIPNFQKLETLVHLTVLSILATPPATPGNGECYIIGVGATGVWVGLDDNIAVFYTSAGAWTYVSPAVGLRAFNRATTSYWRYDGADWLQEPLADVVGPAGATAAHVAIFNGTTGKVIADSGKALPAGFIVGTTDIQVLTNKVIDGADNDLHVRLALDVVGNLPVGNLNNGRARPQPPSGVVTARGERSSSPTPEPASRSRTLPRSARCRGIHGGIASAASCTSGSTTAVARSG